tara:strand:+ start:719 stop:1660 length:942 start_codon:yes stop_codon:yes gene_type:complete
LRKKLNYKILLIHAVYWLYEFHWMALDDDWNKWTFLLFYPIYIGIFYLNYFLLIPRIIKVPNFKSILTWYFVFFLLYTFRRFFTHYIGFHYFQTWGLINIYEGSLDYWIIWKNVILGFIGNTSAVLAVSLGSRFVVNQSKLIELKRKKVKNELSTFKNQIDIPETINILEKLEGKAKLNPGSIQEEIIQLSSVLRYHLYTRDSKITLTKELDVVNNQVDLYNRLNKGNVLFYTSISEGNIQTGILSKVVGEVLKHTQTVKASLDLYKQGENILFKIKDENNSYIKKLNESFHNKFGKQINIKTGKSSIIIQLN